MECSAELQSERKPPQNVLTVLEKEKKVLKETEEKKRKIP